MYVSVVVSYIDEILTKAHVCMCVRWQKLGTNEPIDGVFIRLHSLRFVEPNTRDLFISLSTVE